MINIIPVDDLKEHEESSTCECCPDLQFANGEMIIVHNSFDERELNEPPQDSNNKSMIQEIKMLKEENAKLQAFKDYVHSRLDEAGVEKNPQGEHSKAGCRIGDRLDIVLSAYKPSEDVK